jgi:hypothetical protein
MPTINPGNSGQNTETDKSTEGMVDYDHHSIQQRRIVGSAARLIRDLVPKIGLVAPEFLMVDYGCGPGGNTFETVRPAIEAYRALSATAPMTIAYADQPSNDWSTLFALLSDQKGCGLDDPGIRTEARVGSFYETMAAPGSVSLGTCFTSIHWMSRSMHLETPGTVLYSEFPDAAYAEMAALAETDWLNFLRARASELRAGGYLVVGGVGAVPDPARPRGVAVTSQKLFRAIQVAASSMADDGLLDQSVLDRFVFPCWFRTADEMRRPLEHEADLRDAFEVVDGRVEPTNTYAKDAYADARRDPDRYSERYVGFLRGFGDSTLRSHLFHPTVKDEGDVEPLAAEFYRRFGQLYKEAPDTYATETWQSTLILRRRERDGLF